MSHMTLEYSSNLRAAGRFGELFGQRGCFLLGKARAILGRLVVSANLVVATEQLIEDVWDGAPPPRARAALHVYLSLR